MRSSRSGAGFTLVELLVVIVIISVLVALLLPAVNAARESSRRAHCANNMKQMSLGILQFEEQNKMFPPAEVHGGNHCQPRANIGIWMNLIFPFIELQVDYDKIDFKANPQGSVAGNRTIMQKKYPIFLCPSDPYDGLTSVSTDALAVDNNDANDVARICHYGVVAGAKPRALKHPDNTALHTAAADLRCNAQEGIFYNDSGLSMANVRDGASTTAMLAETWGRVWRHEIVPTNMLDRPSGYPAYSWSNGMNHFAMVFFEVSPNLDHRQPDRVNSFHPGGVQVSFADGSIRFIANTMDFATYQALSTRNGTFLPINFFRPVATLGGTEVLIDPSLF